MGDLTTIVAWEEIGMVIKHPNAHVRWVAPLDHPYKGYGADLAYLGFLSFILEFMKAACVIAWILLLLGR